MFRIARRVANDRVISTVDPDARHGHKTSARGFDGYKGHVAVDPDSEIITDTAVTAGNAGDGSVAADLIDDLTDDTAIDDDADGDGVADDTLEAPSSAAVVAAGGRGATRRRLCSAGRGSPGGPSGPARASPHPRRRRCRR